MRWLNLLCTQPWTVDIFWEQLGFSLQTFNQLLPGSGDLEVMLGANSDVLLYKTLHSPGEGTACKHCHVGGRQVATLPVPWGPVS